MKRLKIAFVFISLFIVRWASLPTGLPPSWTPESKVRYSARVVERPEYTDTNTIIRIGKWYINILGYADIIPGSVVAFTGKVDHKVLGNATTKIVMMDPIFEVIKQSTCHSPLALGCFRVWTSTLRHSWELTLDKMLPNPMSSLAAGILLGTKGNIESDFYDDLVSTGTLHIVAASGYNVMIVASVIMQLIGGLVTRTVAIAYGVIGIVIYVIMAGSSPSVVRAGIMGSLTLIAFYFGRPTEAKRLLWITMMVMLLVDPVIIIDIGFQLSFMATFGLLYLAPIFDKLPKQPFISAYLYPTLAASIATLPILYYHFGRVSWISPLVNMMILPVVPLIMAMSAIVVGISMIIPALAQLIAYLLYPVLWYMVEVIRWWG